MKKYILKRTVYNNIDFPVGTIVKPIKEEFRCFEVVSGKLKGEKGEIADGLKGWVCEYTPQNVRRIKNCQSMEKQLLKQLKINARLIDSIPNATGDFKKY